MKPLLTALLLAFAGDAPEIPIDLLAAITKARPVTTAPPKAEPKPQPVSPAFKSPVYQWRVKRIAPPAGYQRYNVEGEYSPSKAFAYQHLISAHGRYLQEVTSKTNLSSMSLADIRAIHNLIHSIEDGHMAPRRIGYWEQQCPADGGPCVFTFVFELP